MLTETRTRKQRRIRMGRIDWKDPRNIICIRLAEYGLHGQIIAKICNLSRAQVYYRHWKVGITVRNYRNGETRPAREIIQKYNIKTISPILMEELKKQVVTPINF